MITLEEKYLRMVQQGWIPIFVNDDRDAVILAEACVRAGLSIIEITCRRPDALKEINIVKKRWPDLIVLAGSTVENEQMVRFVNSRSFSLPTIRELAESGADGFISIFPFSRKMIDTYKHSHLLIPGVSNLTEAYQMISKGAHIAKMVCTPPEAIGLYTSAPTHQLIPILVTGGVTISSIDEYVKQGITLLAGGWDIMISDKDKEDMDSYSRIVQSFVSETQSARARYGSMFSGRADFPWFSPFQFD